MKRILKTICVVSPGFFSSMVRLGVHLTSEPLCLDRSPVSEQRSAPHSSVCLSLPLVRSCAVVPPQRTTWSARRRSRCSGSPERTPPVSPPSPSPPNGEAIRPHREYRPVRVFFSLPFFLFFFRLQPVRPHQASFPRLGLVVIKIAFFPVTPLSNCPSGCQSTCQFLCLVGLPSLLVRSFFDLAPLSILIAVYFYYPYILTILIAIYFYLFLFCSSCSLRPVQSVQEEEAPRPAPVQRMGHPHAVPCLEARGRLPGHRIAGVLTEHTSTQRSYPSLPPSLLLHCFWPAVNGDETRACELGGWVGWQWVGGGGRAPLSPTRNINPPK